jgi:hypothetical protein
MAHFSPLASMVYASRYWQGGVFKWALSLLRWWVGGLRDGEPPFYRVIEGGGRVCSCLCDCEDVIWNKQSQSPTLRVAGWRRCVLLCDSTSSIHKHIYIYELLTLSGHVLVTRVLGTWYY